MKRKSLNVMITADLYDRFMAALDTSIDVSKQSFIENAIEDALDKLLIGED